MKGDRTSSGISIAGHLIDEPLVVLRDYASTHARTVRDYDLAPADCGPNSVCDTEVKRTRTIASRISNKQAQQMLRALAAAPLEALPSTASLIEADPGVPGGLYDAMQEVYSPLLDIPWVSHAKASKLLHIKRPALFPILDSKLMQLYREPAAAAAQRYPERSARRLYWAAIREDVLANGHQLAAVRQDIRKDDDRAALARLSDVRLLDILAWAI